jgi:pimeloyl-ACP methyl ester carboxylesterase
MSDSIRQLTRQICEFRDARDWRQFHSPKDLAVAITAEAGELLQHFVWQSPEQSEARVVERRAEVAAEMARKPSARLIEIADAGHAPALMAADQISAIRDFLTAP